MPKFKKNLNPQVFLEISIDGRPTERITFEVAKSLFADVVPKTAENFRALCTGEKGLGQSTKKPLYFKGTHIHRIIPGFMAQGGDFSRGDGRGGESIYGGKFQDENFKLKHDQPGILSMANSGEDSNGSQFFMTFKAVPHLDGKHVVFGKMLNGKALLKKLEGLGSESGKPTSLVKIVDCGEVSNIDTQNQLHGEKEKKLKRAVEDNSDTGGRVKTKKPSSVDKRRKKGKNYSSDSCSSETSDSQSYSSDSGSDSESYSSASSDTSSSSDHRHKRRKGSKKVKRKPAKRKSSHKKSKSKSKSRGTKKSKRSYGRSSDDSKSSSSSSDNESAGCRTNHLLKKDAENSKTINLEIGKSLEYTDKGKQTVAGSKPLHKDENGADERVIIQNSEDRSNKFRDDTNPIRADTTLSRADGNITAVAAGTGMSGAGAERNPLSNEPVPTTGQDLAVGSTEDGRVRKGRGFTQKYSFARRYRTPSPECSHLRSSYNGGRNDRWNNFNRYGRNGPYGVRSPVRRYHGSPRAGSPPRYTRRDQSRSRSHSPVRCRDGGRRHRRPSPRRSRSPSEQHKRDVAYRPRSGHGGGGGPSASRGRSGSRSKNRDASRSRSPDDAPSKRVSSKYNRRGSSSSISSSPSGSKGGLVSY